LGPFDLGRVVVTQILAVGIAIMVLGAVLTLARDFDPATGSLRSVRCPATGGELFAKLVLLHLAGRRERKRLDDRQCAGVLNGAR
jgi:hypothetical protein